jgi:8-oxo-dGTP pyrophosphatase MutT (NUDIX family)
MINEQGASNEPRRPQGPRNPGDAWVAAPDGQRYWGRFGAAGLLAFDRRRGILLQHRASWSHHGDTWGLPGGALHENETAAAAALREAAEEAGVPAASVRPRVMSVLDLGVWSYSTLAADVTVPFEPVISDHESRELTWVPLDEVESFPLHPAFAASWPRLRALLAVRPVVVVDAANVIGSVPDGWWKDRAGAARRLLEAVGHLAVRGIPANVLGLPEDLWFPDYAVVVEGQSRGVTAPGLPAVTMPTAVAAVELVRAQGSGDDAIVSCARRLAAEGRQVTVATSDRGLADRCAEAGAGVIGAGQLRDVLAY